MKQNWLELFKKKQSIKEKALGDLVHKEEKYLQKQAQREKSWVNQKLEEVVPKQLEEKLHLAFIKAFEWVFEKGTGIIEKTYKKETHEQNFEIHAYSAKIKKDKKSMDAFSKQAKNSQNKNLVFSSIEGIGLGALGIGLPDIPLFTAMLLKSIYEVALSYGFSYESEEEQLFILKMIEVALLNGDALIKENQVLNEWIQNDLQLEWINKEKKTFAELKKLYIQNAAKAFSEELLYMKFIQGIPIVGMIGGMADAIYLKRITNYATLKYKRRFLQKGEPMNHYH